MNINKNLIDELTSIRDELQNDRLSVDSALKKFEACKELLTRLPFNGNNSYNIIKSFFVTFNINNMSEATVLIKSKTDQYEIIESAGTSTHIEYIQEQLSDDINFYKEASTISLHGKTLKLFYETMITHDYNYTLLTVSESVFFKPSQFHMLSDIIMDLLRSEKSETNPLYNDLFENVLIEINNLILPAENEIHSIFLFKFEYMPVFVENIGITSIVELSDSVQRKLADLFREDVWIFRISLARFLIFFRKDNSSFESFLNYQKKGKFNFEYRGIVLPHYYCNIPYDHSKTIYDIFESIFTIEKGIITNSIAI